MKKCLSILQISMISSVSLYFVFGCSSGLRQAKDVEDEYLIAAYVWPSCHDEPMSREKLWGQGIGEWEIIQKGDPRFEGHYQPKLPLWGYKMDDDPFAWEQKIEAATSHGVNTFIFDWYWYDGKPFLEETLDEGFLKAGNHKKMNFYLMWANHDVPGNMWNHFRYKNDSLIWTGDIDRNNYKIIVNRIIKKYFSQPNYFRINNEPVFSIFSASNLIRSFGTLEKTREAIDYFRGEVKKAGIPGLHIQLIGWGSNLNPHLGGEEYFEGKSINEIVSFLEINSITTYNWTGSGIHEDYLEWGEKAMLLQKNWDSSLTIPYFPNVSIGWDNTPRYPQFGKDMVVYLNNTPESFSAYLIKAKEYADNHTEQPKLIIINAWNEWVEGSYLEPDMKWGYGYLEAVKKVFKERMVDH